MSLFFASWLGSTKIMLHEKKLTRSVMISARQWLMTRYGYFQLQSSDKLLDSSEGPVYTLAPTVSINERVRHMVQEPMKRGLHNANFSPSCNRGVSRLCSELSDTLKKGQIGVANEKQCDL